MFANYVYPDYETLQRTEGILQISNRRNVSSGQRRKILPIRCCLYFPAWLATTPETNGPDTPKSEACFPSNKEAYPIDQ